MSHWPGLGVRGRRGRGEDDGRGGRDAQQCGGAVPALTRPQPSPAPAPGQTRPRAGRHAHHLPLLATPVEEAAVYVLSLLYV